jgi:hypothetical protein
MKPTIKTLLSAAFGLACICSSIAATDIKDGFAESHQQVLVTVNGTTKVMENNMKLRSGIVVRTDGTIIVPGGDRTVLKEGDTMTFGGTITRAATGKVEQLNPSE